MNTDPLNRHIYLYIYVPNQTHIKYIVFYKRKFNKKKIVRWKKRCRKVKNTETYCFALISFSVANIIFVFFFTYTNTGGVGVDILSGDGFVFIAYNAIIVYTNTYIMSFLIQFFKSISFFLLFHKGDDVIVF